MIAYPKQIPENALNLKPARPEFQEHFHNIIGNAVTHNDGFETLIAPAVRHVADTRGFIAGFDSDLRGIGADQNELRLPFHKVFSDSLVGVIKQGQRTFNNFILHLTGQNPPQSGPAPTPGSGAPAPAPGTQRVAISVTLVVNARPPLDNPKILFTGSVL